MARPKQLASILSAIAAMVCSLQAGAAQHLVIEAEKIMTVTDRGTIGPAWIVVQSGRIVSVDARLPAAQPPHAIRLKAKVVTPGLIDARTTLGLTAMIDADDEGNDVSGPNQAHLRAIDGFNVREPLLAEALRSGITVVQSGPGRANSIGGQAGIFKTFAGSTGAATIRFPSAMVFALTESAKTTYGKNRKFPSTRMANVGLIRQALIDAARHSRLSGGGQPPPRDLRLEALALVLERKIPAIVSAERVDEIATAMRLAEEFDIDVIVSGAGTAELLLDHLARFRVPLLVGPRGDKKIYEDGRERLLALPAALAAEGISFALVSGVGRDESPRSLLARAAMAVRYGLDPDRALASITLDAARILGLESRVGSVETGKDADLVLYDGDPFAYATHIEAVVVNGRIAYQRQ
jgi:imidazolonepropionase-like amidohydrolase